MNMWNSKKFKQLWNNHIRLFFADLILFETGCASAVHYTNGTEWYWIALLIFAGLLTSDNLRNPITEYKDV